jgi:hypothetical protein
MSAERLPTSEMPFLSEPVCDRRDVSAEAEPSRPAGQLVPAGDARKGSLIATVFKLLLLVYHASQYYKIKYNVGPAEDDNY